MYLPPTFTGWCEYLFSHTEKSGLAVMVNQMVNVGDSDATVPKEAAIQHSASEREKVV